MRRGGLETMLMNYYRHIDRNKVQFDFLVHRDYESDYDQEIQALGGKIYHISRLIPWSKLYRKKLCAFFKEHPEYRIVHVHQDCLSSVALECAQKCGIPVRIAHSHNSNQDKNWKYIVKLYYMRFIPEFATDFFACGKEAGDWMFRGHSYSLLKNAIDSEKYRYSPERAKQVRKKLQVEDSIVIGHVGRFNPQKNHGFLLKIFKECEEINPNVRLLLVGEGEEQEKIEEKAKEMGLYNKVIFTGARSDVNDLMQAMDVFVLPSLYEGLPLTMIEAQTSGLHCVISETVPDECVVTKDLVRYCKLEDKPSEWAEIIMQQSLLPRKSHDQEIKDSGYDITSAAQNLEDFYVRSSKR
ncbi:glycosyltransferase family 1 protein [Anaerostipes butyraticus]|nr:glycosyltransferase family 1 protein [Anaerostipes butyraticus]